MRLFCGTISYRKAIFASFDLQLAVSSSEKYPHIVHEEHSEEIDDDKYQDCMTDCNLDVLEGTFTELLAEYYFLWLYFKKLHSFFSLFFCLLQVNDASVLCEKVFFLCLCF